MKFGKPVPGAERKVTLNIFHRTPNGKSVCTLAVWPPKNGPRVLAEFMEEYRTALLPGGKCEYVSEFLGYAPVPHLAFVSVDGQTREIWDTNRLASARTA